MKFHRGHKLQYLRLIRFCSEYWFVDAILEFHRIFQVPAWWHPLFVVLSQTSKSTQLPGMEQAARFNIAVCARMTCLCQNEKKLTSNFHENQDALFHITWTRCLNINGNWVSRIPKGHPFHICFLKPILFRVSLPPCTIHQMYMVTLRSRSSPKFLCPSHPVGPEGDGHPQGSPSL